MLKLFRSLRTSAPAVALAFAAAALLIAGPATGSARPHATPAPTPTPVADPAITKIARQQFVQWQAGAVNKSLYAPQVVPKLTDDKIADTARALGELGPLTDMVYIGRWINPDMPTLNGYIYQMRCATGNVYLWLELQPDGKIASIVFKNRLDVENVTPAPSPTPT
ncbi:MAG TPA: hypothetical protein VKE42_02340 [Candidatus Cybelea sp.]|nr:hypothetical protein [Candidatus Cybelea sp.]